MIETEAPGKVILVGEYAVLYGAPALVAAVNRCARVRLHPAESFSLRALGLTARANDCESLRALDGRLALVAAVFETLDADPLPPVAVEIDTQAFYAGPEKLGLGSSAAVAVALSDALRRFRGEMPSAETRFRDAYLAHRLAQGGVGSGVDIAASAHGGVFVYRAPVPGECTPAELTPLGWPDALQWTVVFTGHSASTPQLVGAVEALRESAPSEAAALIAELRERSEQAVVAFAAGDPAEFVLAIERFRRGLVALGEAAGISIHSEAHERCRRVAQRRGAVYKPSGAGGGDIGVAFWSTGEPPPFTDPLDMALYPAATEPSR